MAILDLTSEADQDRLAAVGVKSFSELDAMVRRVERDVLAHYTAFDRPKTLTVHDPSGRPPAGWVWLPWNTDPGYALGRGYYIRLRGYDPDPARCHPGLLEALKDAVVDVVAHRLSWRTGMGRQTRVKGQKDGQAETARDWAADLFPPGWDQGIRPYEAEDDTLFCA